MDTSELLKESRTGGERGAAGALLSGRGSDRAVAVQTTSMTVGALPDRTRRVLEPRLITGVRVTCTGILAFSRIAAKWHLNQYQKASCDCGRLGSIRRRRAAVGQVWRKNGNKNGYRRSRAQGCHLAGMCPADAAGILSLIAQAVPTNPAPVHAHTTPACPTVRRSNSPPRRPSSQRRRSARLSSAACLRGGDPAGQRPGVPPRRDDPPRRGGRVGGQGRDCRHAGGHRVDGPPRPRGLCESFRVTWNDNDTTEIAAIAVMALLIGHLEGSRRAGTSDWGGGDYYVLTGGKDRDQVESQRRAGGRRHGSIRGGGRAERPTRYWGTCGRFVSVTAFSHPPAAGSQELPSLRRRPR